MIRYPTREEILRFLPPLAPAEVAYLRQFPSTFRNLPELIRFGNAFCKEFGLNAEVRSGRKSRFLHGPRVIELGAPRLIELLHEMIGHARFGRSELVACRAATAMIFTLYPELRKTAVWKGHDIINAP